MKRRWQRCHRVSAQRKQGAGLRQGSSQGGLPFGSAHAGHVASEAGGGEAGVALGARLPLTVAAQLDLVAVVDAHLSQRLGQPLAAELGVTPGAGEAPHVDDRPRPGCDQHGLQLLDRPSAMADREDHHPGQCMGTVCVESPGLAEGET